MTELNKAIEKIKKHDLSTIGRSLIGSAFIVFGLGHLLGAQMLAYYVPFLIPFKVLWVVLSGIIFIVAGSLLIFQKYVYETAIYLSWFLVALSVLVYLIPLNIQGIFFNAALIGGLLILADKHDKNERGVFNFIKSIFKK